jgi:hypothetical protein
MFMYFRVDHWVPEPCRGEVQAGLTVGERSDDGGSSPDLAHDALEGVVGADLDPMAVGEGVVGEHLGDVRVDEVRVPQSASVMSSTRRTETPARYISISASSTELSRRR